MTSRIRSRKWIAGAGVGVVLLVTGAAFGPIPGFEDENEGPLPANGPKLGVAEVLEIAIGEHADADPMEIELENEDGLVFGVEFSDGFEVEMNADTGEIIETEQEDKADDDEDANVLTSAPELSFTDARDAALALDGNASADVLGIELENESGQLAYSVELSNGSEVELDANTGNILEIDPNEDEYDDE